MAADPGGAHSWLPFVQAAVTWVLVIIGWRVVSRDQNRREHRKELRAAVDRCCKRISDVTEKALELWALPGTDAKAAVLAMRIRAEITQIALERERIQSACTSARTAAQLIAFRQAVTGEDFDQPTRPARGPSSAQFANITQASAALVVALEEAFHQTYVKPPSRLERLNDYVYRRGT